MNSLQKKTIFSLLTGSIVIIVIEVVLHLSAAISPKIETLLYPFTTEKAIIQPTVPDERLGFRPNPEYPDHDSRGFRNPGAYATADIVALGDSQTYGTSVNARDAWPRKLENMINERVYNMSFGGYCPAHSLILWDEALALHPKIIIEAFYAGNDLFECYELVYKKGQLPDFRDTSSATQMKLASAEKADPLEKKVVWLQGMIFGKLNNSGPGKAANVSTNKSIISENKVSWPRKFLSQHSMIYALLRATYWTLTSISSEESALDKDIVIEDIPARVKLYPEYLELFDDGHYKTAFTPEYRRAVVNLEDTRMTEGHLVALKSIQRMSELAESRHIRFLVVLIPTKESVFQDIIKTPTTHYSSLIEAERIMWERTKQFLSQKGIEYVDAQPALGQQLAAGKQPYYNSTDGHPNAFGHEAIAVAVKHELDHAGKQ